uniref:Transposase MuDR plant domain-containing protein n=1 Tax=Nicotiana tabacum TaxID=4097 RepID=A0A1S3Z303_TOBAC|nr:PREDICTED: uncharacterized protein LOC107782209 [Nicotiana tabacum]
MKHMQLAETSRMIPNDNVIEIYFEHLDSYFSIENMDSVYKSNARDNDKHQFVRKNLSSDDFSNSEDDLSDDLLIDIHEKIAESIIDESEILSVEVKRKMVAPERESDYGDKPILALEITFASKQDFKNAVATHEINNGKYIKWKKNNKERIKAVCIHPECEWKIMAYKMQRDTTLQIRKYKPKYTCKEWNYKNRTITSSFIARKYLKEIKSNRGWSLLEFRDRVSVDLRAKVTLSQAKRAKMKAIALIDGDIKDQYKMMWDYCIEIDRTNPGSTIHMKFTDNEVPNKPYRFQRIYICFAACKQGYKAGCRKIIGVDGCWLKGPMYGTQLLSAVRIDADLDIDASGLTFMSDKQKGLIEVFNEVLPHVSNRFCARHLHNNFKRAGFSGFTLKKVFWAAAKAATMEEFDACMLRMTELDTNIVAWLNDKT